MKKTCNNALLALFLVILCFQSIQITNQTDSSSQYMNFESTNEEQVNENSINIPNLRKLVKPFYEKPFEPTYVDSIQARKRIIASPTMSRVETLSSGMAEEPGFKEKPVIFTTIVEPKNTSIRHSKDVNYDLYKESKQIKYKQNNKVSEKKDAKAKLRPGEFSIPVTVAGNAVRKDPTKQEYLKPNFEGSYSHTENANKVKGSGDIYYDAFRRIAENDNNLIRRATEGSDKSPQAIEKKIENLMVARKMIKSETKDLLLKLRKNISKLTETKEVNTKLNELLDKFYNSVKERDSQDVTSLLKKLESSLKANK